VDRTRVLIASPLEAELVERIREAEPRAEVVYEPDLLPPARYPGDHRGDPEFRRDHGAEARWRALLDRAEVLFGIPGDSADGLVEVVTGLPRLRWVHATSAGAGEVVRKAALPAEALERVVVTTSSGVHAVPLAEFAILGLLAVAKELPRLLDAQRARAWPEIRQPFRELSGQTLFLVGLGEIGRETARPTPWW
jgi:phosphoglycerate dehydrogenase-like enzyme